MKKLIKLIFLKNKIMIISRVFLVVMLFTMFSCDSEKKSRIIHLYSKDRSQVVSVISDYVKNERIIAVGKHKSKPVKDYIKLDISETSKIGDEIGICWNVNGNQWEMVNDKTKVVKWNLDTTKYVFRENWFKDGGSPNAKYYRQSDCYTVGVLNYSKQFPEENGWVEKFD